MMEARYQELQAESLRGEIARRTEALMPALDAATGDVETVWLGALRDLVESVNDTGRFGDILSDSRLSDQASAPLGNPLSGLSVPQISILYEFLLATVSMGTKRSKGQFFTPDDIAQFMATRAARFPDGIWLDPCCGVGNLSYWLVRKASQPEAFLSENLRFADIDELALFTARVLMTLSFQDRKRELFSRIEPNFAVGDFLDLSLLASPPFEAEFDYIIMNPPYVQISDNSGNFETASSRDLYAFFMERALKSAKGTVCITPQSFTNGKRHRALRRVILDNSEELNIYVFDNVPDTVFKGLKFGSENTNQVNSTRAAITVSLKKSAGGEGKGCERRVTPLLRWRASERTRLLEKADSFLAAPSNLSETLFPKVMPGLEPLFDELSNSSLVLKDLIQGQESDWVLHIPTTPRYFVSAVQRDLARSSVRTLYFPSREEMIRAYLLLNSSVMYFWWRARDGGMTLSQETLLSVPIVGSPGEAPAVIEGLVSRLEESEASNVVVKVNAGKANENVKHPLSLIDALNHLLTPKYAKQLLALHSNTVLTGEVCRAVA